MYCADASSGLASSRSEPVTVFLRLRFGADGSAEPGVPHDAPVIDENVYFSAFGVPAAEPGALNVRSVLSLWAGKVLYIGVSCVGSGGGGMGAPGGTEAPGGRGIG